MTAPADVDQDAFYADDDFTDPDRDGRNFIPVDRPATGGTDEATRNGRHWTREQAPAEPVDAGEDDPFLSPADDEATTEDHGRGHTMIGLGAAGTFATVGGLIVFHLVGGGILLVGAAGAALATSAGVAGVRAARGRRAARAAGGPAGTGRGRRGGRGGIPGMGGRAPRAGRPGRGAGRRQKLRGGGTGGKGGGLGLPKLGGKKGTGGPKAGRKLGKGKPTATSGARSTGLAPKKKPAGKGTGGPGAARRKKLLGGGTGTGGGKGRGLGLGGGRGRAGKGGAHRPGSARTPRGGGILSRPRGGGRTTSPRPTVGGTTVPRGPIGRRRWANKVGPGARDRMRTAIGNTTGLSPRRRRLLDRALTRANRRDARRAALPRGTVTWRRVGAVTAAGGGLAGLLAGGWVIPATIAAGSASLGLMLGTSRGRRALRTAGYHTVWRPIRATVVRPVTRLSRWVGRSVALNSRLAWSWYAWPAVKTAWYWTLALPGRQYRRIRRRIRVWYRKFLVLARYARTRDAWAAFWTAALMALAGLMRSIARVVWAPKPSTSSPAPTRVADPDAHDDEQDTDATPIGVPPEAPPAPPAPPTRNTGGAARRRRLVGNRPPAPTVAPTRATTIGGALHPYHVKILEASREFVAGFEPRSIPDLNRYLESQPDGMRIHGDHYSALADTLAARFPGATLVHAQYHNVATGYTYMSAKAGDLHKGYRQLHRADLARHEQPRVNEHLADVARQAHGGNIPTIGGGGTMHENHACMIAATRQYVAGYFPSGASDDDAVADLLWYLDSQGPAFVQLCEDMRFFAGKLVTNYPVDKDVHAYYFELATGYANLADAAAELAGVYRTMNAHDVARREKPRVNEPWADYANK
jgi:hypothetical protein